VPEWLQKSFESDVHVTLWVVIVRQLTALALGATVAMIYRFIDGRRGGRQAMEMMATLTLLTVLISMMTAVIGDNIARAFAIVGALSIVRFRTVVEDTRDTAFVICAVAVGLAVGAGYVLIPLVTLPIVAIAGFAFLPRQAGSGFVRGADRRGAAGNEANFLLTVRVSPAYSTASLLEQPMQRHTESSRLIAMATARQGAAFEKTYAVHLRDAAAVSTLVAEIGALEGVQNVDLRQE
jgi:hypothetical protein